MNYRILSLALLLMALLSVSCDKTAVVDMYQHIDDSQWTWDDMKQFSFDFTDTITEHNILIQLRHTTNYPMSNLYMFVHVKGPSGQTLTDTINFVLAEPDGKWRGRGTGNIRELRYLYRKQTIFPEAGTYTILLEQGMREPVLPVSDLGVRIEKVNP